MRDLDVELDAIASLIVSLKSKIMTDAPDEFTASDIYHWDGVGDITMYLALSELVTEQKLIGPDPYDTELNYHDLWNYKKAI